MSLSHDLAKEFLTQLNHLRDTKGEDIEIGDIDGLFKHLKSEERESLYEGIQDIASKISTVKIEIAAEHPDKISGDKLPDANLELDAIVKATEDATNTILDNAEKIQALAGEIEGEKGEKIIEAVTAIFEASNFQDITGQRINKVVTTLIEIETSVNTLLEALGDKITIKAADKKEATGDEALMRGPQLENDAPSQDDIDKLFDSA